MIRPAAAALATQQRCPKCHGRTDREDLCWRCARTCARKRRYYSYEQAKTARVAVLESDGQDDPLLDVYRCGDHWHLGHATGRRARALLKHAEKLRRKKLWKDATCE